jgi:hypothetical protein
MSLTEDDGDEVYYKPGACAFDEKRANMRRERGNE